MLLSFNCVYIPGIINKIMAVNIFFLSFLDTVMCYVRRKISRPAKIIVLVLSYHLTDWDKTRGCWSSLWLVWISVLDLYRIGYSQYFIEVICKFPLKLRLCPFWSQPTTLLTFFVSAKLNIFLMKVESKRSNFLFVSWFLNRIDQVNVHWDQTLVYRT